MNTGARSSDAPSPAPGSGDVEHLATLHSGLRSPGQTDTAPTARDRLVPYHLIRLRDLGQRLPRMPFEAAPRQGVGKVGMERGSGRFATRGGRVDDGAGMTLVVIMAVPTPSRIAAEGSCPPRNHRRSTEGSATCWP